MDIAINPHAEGAVIAADQSLAKEISAELSRHYPGHAWAVNVDSRTGMAVVENWNLSTRDGFRIRMNDLATHNDVKRMAVKAGGEFLERFGLARGRADQDEVRDHAQRAWMN
ncbi:hypothetical protein E6C67_14205 [Azospirillum sp. TSA2s]|uniref:hypothetical protein n=1 Tax=Azospirillum sp. TSA2s TaxID=709810 RepID=UPI0010AAA763|nr:hypothetical protein [Azospirillum sp. TSA2s]QCG94982.1 hypothetical protein E6C67_14205 [Azospirillum sp. TSA2s]